MRGLLFIRHAQTHMAGTFCGHSDPPVDARGEQQIRNLSERLASEKIEAICCSDLVRAVTTAGSLAEAFVVPLRRRRGLREMYFGDWEGLSWGEIELRDPAYARRWIETFPNLQAPGGESFADFETRVRDELDHLLLVAQDKRVAVVTHGGVMRLALRILHGCSDQKAWEKTRSYCCFFAYEGATNPLEANL